VGWPVLGWVRKLRVDPLARLELDEAGEEDVRALIRAAVPAPTPSQRSRVDLAVHDVTRAASEALPRAWADAVRAAAQTPGDDLSATLDGALAGVDLRTPAPGWWRTVTWVQVLATVLGIGGFGWLAVIGVAGAVRPRPLPTPFVGPVPLPTLLLVTGAALTLIFTLVARAAVAGGARRHRAGVTQALHAVVLAVAETRVLGPVAQVLADHRTAREALASTH
jgi:hypothetical protein